MGVSGDNVFIDSIQTHRKAWNDDLQAHRVNSVSEKYSKELREYDSAGNLSVIKYYYDSAAESYKYTARADINSDLVSQHISFSTPSEKYYIWFRVNQVGYSPEINGRTGIKVDINENDPAAVIAAACQLTLNAYEEFSVDRYGDTFTISNVEYGESVSAGTNGSGFSVETLVQGVTELVETITYSYNSNGDIDCIINSSGTNMMNQDSSKTNSISISDGINKVKVGDNNRLKIENDPETQCIQEKIYNTLEKIETQLSFITNEEL